MNISREQFVQATEDDRRAAADRAILTAESYERNAVGSPHESVLLAYGRGYRNVVSNLLDSIPIARERAGAVYDQQQAPDTVQYVEQ